jgi:hypothetical protein
VRILPVTPGEKVFFTEDDDSSDESADEESDQEFKNYENESEEESMMVSEKFCREVIDSIAGGLEQGVASDNLVLEINGSKHAW